MRIVFLVPLLLIACFDGKGTLYPTQADMDRKCPQVVESSYKSLSRYTKRSTLSTLTTVLIVGASCAATSGLYCILSGPGAFTIDKTLDPYGKKSAANEFNNNMRIGRDMKCTETWK